MKIVDRKTFLSYPADTLFSKYEPCKFGSMMIKGDTLNHERTEFKAPDAGLTDFQVQQIEDAVLADSTGVFDILEHCKETGESFDIDLDCWGRDGLYEQHQLFVVWEKEDVQKLMNRLTLVYKVFPSTEVMAQTLFDEWNRWRSIVAPLTEEAARSIKCFLGTRNCSIEQNRKLSDAVWDCFLNDRLARLGEPK